MGELPSPRDLTNGLCLDTEHIDILFPFHIGFDDHLSAISVGSVLQRLVPAARVGRRISDYLQIARPRMALSYAALAERSESAFIFEFSDPAGLRLKGQAISLPGDRMLFVGSPLITDLEDLTKFGLHAGDYAVHDLAADFLFLLQAQRRASQEAQAAHQELLRAERLSTLGRLTATVAHELRNPLSAIRNSIALAREVCRLDPLGVKLDRAFSRAERSIGRCDEIVSHLLDYSKSRELRCEPITVDAWLAELIEDQRQLLPKEVILDGKLGAAAAQISCDPDRLRRVFVNLIENASQALLGYDTADKRIVIRSRVDESSVLFSVEDNGPGISEEVLARIFEPLFSTKSFGTGLGLPTVKQIVEQHQGEIQIRSSLREGTTAQVSIPLLSPTSAAVTSQNPSISIGQQRDLDKVGA